MKSPRIHILDPHGVRLSDFSYGEFSTSVRWKSAGLPPTRWRFVRHRPVSLGTIP